MDIDDIDERRRLIALFRQQVIEGLDEPLERGELTTRVLELARQLFTPPLGTPRRFSQRTIWYWLKGWRKAGLIGLVPSVRPDRGTPKSIRPDVLDAAVQLRRELPSRSTATLIDILERQRRIPKGTLARSTLDHHLGLAGASRRILKTLGSKRHIRLQFERPNELWVGDYHEAPILYDEARGRWRTVHFGGFIDHHSKLVVHGEWYGNERIATLEDSFKKAILKRGVPGKVYVDNAKVYRSDQFAFAIWHVGGGKVVHSKSRISEGRGVIERFNRTLAEQFEPEARAARIGDLARLNVFFEGWLEERYHRAKHGSTGEAPIDRFANADFKPRYPDPVKVQDTFRVRGKRRVQPKTSTVEVDGIAFVVETFLRGRWVEVRYDPHRLDDVLVYLKGKRVQRAFPQKPNEHPQPTPDRATAAPPAFDYLAAIRADYDKRIVAQARRLTLSDWKPSRRFTVASFLALYAQLLGKELAPYEREELTRCFNTVGPFSEKTCRLALDQALKLLGRGLHVSVYSHYLKTFHLAALEGFQEEP